jgi:hypothetical protein
MYPIFGLLILALLIPFLPRGAALLLPHGEPSRAATGISAALLVATGVLVPRSFIYNGGDNAYLLIAMVGMGLIIAAVPFGAATVPPSGTVRTVVVKIGLGFALLLATLGLITLGWSPFAFTAEDVRDEVARAHLYAMLVAVPASLGALLACRLLPESSIGTRV